MNDFVRQIAVLSVLWAMCELLLPEGKQQQMVRATASLLVMTALLTTVGGWLNGEKPAQTVMTHRIQQTSENQYQRTALMAAANQLESYCMHMAQRAGYQAEGTVYLRLDGAVDHIELKLMPTDVALLSPEEVAQMLSEQMQVERGCILLSVEEI